MTCSPEHAGELRQRNRLVQSGIAVADWTPKHKRPADIGPGPQRPPDEGAPLAIIDALRPEALRSLAQDTTAEFRARWLAGLAPHVRDHAERIMAGLR